MFFHNLKYSLRILLKNRTLIFWTFAFPIIIVTFFNMAFSDITKKEKLDIIDIAVIDNDEFKNNKIFSNSLKVLSDEKNKDRMFSITYTDKDDAEKLLNDSKIVGYLEIILDKPNLTFVNNGINETIVKYVIEEISDTSVIIDNYIKFTNDVNYEMIYQKINSMLSNSNIKINNTASSNLDYMVIEFYTLVAMTCLYGGALSMSSLNKALADQGNIGKRVSVSPNKKGNIILGNLIAGFITQIIGLIILFVYTVFLLNINYGHNLLLIILLSLVGSLAGLSCGIFVGTIFKTSENNKIGILIGITMLYCFFSGMMGVTMKYIIDKNIPIINKLNPASMITDGFYSLYYYKTYSRYWFNIISLVIFSLILVLLSLRSLRRVKYDSI